MRTRSLGATLDLIDMDDLKIGIPAAEHEYQSLFRGQSPTRSFFRHALKCDEHFRRHPDVKALLGLQVKTNDAKQYISVPIPNATEGETADAAEAVDAYLHHHSSWLMPLMSLWKHLQ